MTSPFPAEPTSILVADDHPIFRRGLVDILREIRDFRIIAETGDGSDALARIQTTTPQVAVLDIDMPGATGIDIARAVQDQGLDTKVILLTMYSDEEYLNEALDLDVRGYILKEDIAEQIVACIRAVQTGRFYVSANISDALVKLRGSSRRHPDSTPGLNSLTPSELQVLRLIAEYKTSTEIARRLGVSIRTIQNHRYNICQKLGLSGHHGLLQYALENKSIIAGG